MCTQPKGDLYANTLYHTGKWLARARSEGANVAKDYLQEAVNLYEKRDKGNACKTFFTLANYADTLYQNLMAKVTVQLKLEATDVHSLVNGKHRRNLGDTKKKSWNNAKSCFKNQDPNQDHQIK